MSAKSIRLAVIILALLFWLIVSYSRVRAVSQHYLYQRGTAQYSTVVFKLMPLFLGDKGYFSAKTTNQKGAFNLKENHFDQSKMVIFPPTNQKVVNLKPRILKGALICNDQALGP